MQQGITTTREFNPGDAKVIDDRNAIDKLRLSGGQVSLKKLMAYNGIEFEPTIRKDDARNLLYAAVTGGRTLKVPLPGGGDAPLIVPAEDIAPRDTPNWGQDAPEPEVTQLSPEDQALERARELKAVKYMALKKAAKDVGLECPDGMSAFEKDQLIKNIVRVEMSF